MTGERIRVKRAESGMSQRELATVLGVSTAAVGMYEQNRRVPSQKILQKMCLLWDVTADYLLYGNTDFSHLPPGPLRVQDFLEQIRGELGRQKGLMFEFGDDGRRHILTDAEVEQLYDAIKIGVEIALRTKNK